MAPVVERVVPGTLNAAGLKKLSTPRPDCTWVDWPATTSGRLNVLKIGASALVQATGLENVCNSHENFPDSNALYR